MHRQIADGELVVRPGGAEAVAIIKPAKLPSAPPNRPPPPPPH